MTLLAGLRWRRQPRWLAHAHAVAFGYFWLPCPTCGRMFGGNEWVDYCDRAQHFGTIPREPGGGTGICPHCTATGVGCRAWATGDIQPPRFHVGCTFAPQPDVTPPGGAWVFP